MNINWAYTSLGMISRYADERATVTPIDPEEMPL